MENSMLNSNILKITISVVGLSLHALSANATLTPPRIQPDELRPIYRVSSLGRTLMEDEAGFYYGNEDDAQGMLDPLQFHRSNRPFLEGSDFVKFIPTSSGVDGDRLEMYDDDTEERVLAGDGRSKIPNPWEFPYSIHGHMRMEIKGKVYIGSGTMIGNKYVLTAGHNVFFRNFDSAPDSITFFPGLHGDQAKWKVEAESYVVHPTYKDISLDKSVVKEYDIGLVTLKTPVGDETGWIDFDPLDDATLSGKQLTVTGYPGDKDNGRCMYTMTGPIKSLTARQVFYDISTAGGQSGSGVIDDSDTLRCVHAYGGSDVTGNKGTRIVQELKDLIERWKVV